MRWPRQLMSLLFVLTLLVGPPMAMLSLVDSPIRGWPDGEQVQAWIQQPLTEQTLSAALTIGAWLVWLVLAYTVTIRVLTRIRAGTRWLRRMPLPTPLQATASGMAGAAVFGVANTPATPPPEPHHPVAAGTLDSPGDTAADLAATTSVWGDDGIEVPGGWLPREVAEQVAAAGALVWLRRRRAYQPRPPGPPARDDLDIAPLPTTVATVQAALADHPPPADTTTAGKAQADEASAWVAGLPATGVGLTGAGALAAARGLLVTVLLTGHRTPAVPLVITRAALTSLLGPAAAKVRQPMPRLQVVSSIDEAVTILESSANRHADQARDESEHREDGQALTAHAPVVIVEHIRSSAAERLAAVVAAAAGTALVLGPWPAGRTWQVDAAGHTHDPHQPGWVGPRFCVLDAVPATDLLTVIGHIDPAPPTPAHPRRPVVPPRQRLPRQASGRDTGTSGRPLELRVLGEPVLLVDGTPLTIRRTAAMQALVFLAAHPDGADSRQLVEALWPGPPRHSLTGRLYTTLSELRGTVRAACGLNVLEHTDDRYRLNRAHLDADLWRFHTAVQHAATAVTNTTVAWQAVIDAYSGELAAGRAWPWLDPIREATRRHVIDAHVALAAVSDPQHALAVLQAAIRVDPYNADLHVRAMNALAALGDHDAAIELYDSYTRRLTEVGLDVAGAVRDAATQLNDAVPHR